MTPEELIPEGMYCHDRKGKPCIYWYSDSNHDEQDNGYCFYLDRGDWESDGLSLLWDQCKECGVNDPHD